MESKTDQPIIKGTLHKTYQLMSPFGQIAFGASVMCGGNNSPEYAIKRPTDTPTPATMTELFSSCTGDAVTMKPFTPKVNALVNIEHPNKRNVIPDLRMTCSWCLKHLTLSQGGVLQCKNTLCRGRLAGRIQSFLQNWVLEGASPFVWHDLVQNTSSIKGVSSLFNDSAMTEIARAAPFVEIKSVEDGLYHLKHTIRMAARKDKWYPYTDLIDIVMSMGVPGLTKETATLLVQHVFYGGEDAFPFLTDCLTSADTLFYVGVDMKDAAIISRNAIDIQDELYSLGDCLSGIQNNDLYDFA